MKTLFALSLAAVLCWGCSGDKKTEYEEKRDAEEQQGVLCLEEARASLEKKDYPAARSAIERMRKEHPLALEARAKGILLLDSINLFEAEAQLKELHALLKENKVEQSDSLQIEFDDLFQKTKFYKRKLEHDRKEQEHK